MSEQHEKAVDEMEQVDRLLEHSYDGIQEYDNPLPGWWKWVFFLSVVFAVPYTIYYEVGNGPTMHQTHQQDVASMKSLQKAFEKKNAAKDLGKTLLTARKNQQALAAGMKIFQTKCSACHLIDGGGSIGPNLTDDHWLYGNTLKQIYKLIRSGKENKGMPPWEKQLSYKELIQVAVYVSTLEGKKPAKAKAPEGKKFLPIQY